MASFTPAGTNLTNRYSFNSGTLDFGNSRIVAIDTLTVEMAFTLLDLMILGSIKAQDKVRHTEKITLTGKLKSYAPEMEMMAAGSSALSTQNTITVLDGQPTFQNPVVTLLDRNGKEIQYQLQNFLFKSTKLTSKQEDYSEWDFEGEAVDMVEVYTP